jgi:hypothetical protein
LEWILWTMGNGLIDVNVILIKYCYWVLGCTYRQSI